MPDRIIKDSITRSKTLAELDFFEEVCFYRLIVKADDFGRFYRDPVILKSELFPRKRTVTEENVDAAFQTLEDVGLIVSYKFKDEQYLQIVNWKSFQRVRATKSKYPDKDGKYTAVDSKRKTSADKSKSDDGQLTTVDDKCPRVADNGGQMPPNTNTKANTKTKTNRGAGPFDEADDQALIIIQKEHDELFDDAKAIGLPLSDKNMSEIVRLYTEYGLEKVKTGISEASRMNKISIAYIEAVCKNSGKKREEPDWEDEVWSNMA